MIEGRDWKGNISVPIVGLQTRPSGERVLRGLRPCVMLADVRLPSRYMCILLPKLTRHLSSTMGQKETPGATLVDSIQWVLILFFLFYWLEFLHCERYPYVLLPFWTCIQKHMIWLFIRIDTDGRWHLFRAFGTTYNIPFWFWWLF